MTMTDPIADFLTRIRNAIMAGHKQVEMPLSRMKEQLSLILKEEGYVNGYETLTPEEGHPSLRIFLKYGPDGEKVVNGLERVSKPGCRVYVGSKEIPEVLGGMGINILTTSRGLMTGSRARSESLGGEVLCNVW
jgi:small subunit ribosomal protein S8